MKIKIDVSDGKNVLFISDFHLYHKNVIKFDSRPFVNEFGEPDVDAMHQTILENWNAVVRPKDVVFYLGDVCFSKWEWGADFMRKLNGEIHFVMGNHDRHKDIVNYKRFKTINDLVDLNIIGSKDDSNIHHFILCHYPIYSWNRMQHVSIHLHGHCHMSLSEKEFHQNRRIFDVGCNGWNYTPISYTEIIKLCENIKHCDVSHH